MFEFDPGNKNDSCACGCSDSSGLFGIFSDSNFSLVQAASTLLNLDLSKASIALDNYLLQTYILLPYSNPILNLGAITGGSGYTNGIYSNVPLIGGMGSGAYATIAVTGGHVTQLQVTEIGSTSYSVGDVLSASSSYIGAGTGFTITVLGYQPVPLSYANIVGSPNEVKLVAIVPQYSSSLSSYPSQQVVQWRFQGTTTWSNIGPFMFLTGTENPAGINANSNLIGAIEFRNMTTKDIKLKVLLGI